MVFYMKIILLKDVINMLETYREIFYVFFLIKGDILCLLKEDNDI